MFAEQDNSHWIPPIQDKKDTLLQVIEKCDELRDLLSDKIFGYIPLCKDNDEQRKAEHVFRNSVAMGEILDVASALNKVQELADKAFRIIEDY